MDKILLAIFVTMLVLSVLMVMVGLSVVSETSKILQDLDQNVNLTREIILKEVRKHE